MTAALIIDSFAGGGGASTDIERALGRSPDVAINHNAAALALHAANHPETLHLSNDIWAVDPCEVTQGRPVGLLWASPDCKHFSKAKGGAPCDRNIRDLAWVIVDWAEKVKPDVILMENVEEFVTWGPLGEDGHPMKEFAGQTFELWVKRLKRAGYRIQWRELRACDYGAPTIRKRFMMVARRDGRPIVWPNPTHGDPTSKAVKQGKLLPWRTAAGCIDWSLPCPSIFDTTAQIKDKHGLRAVRPLAGNTMARIARGMRRYVLDADRPFIVNLTHGSRVEPVDEPFRTITGAHGFSGGRREYPLSEPLGTVTGSGAQHALIAPLITRFNGGATGQDLRAPMATITANSFIKRPGGAAPFGVVAPVLATFYGHNDGRGKRSANVQEPLRTVTTENRHALIAPTMVQVGYGERAGQAPRALDLMQPLGTVVAGSVKHAPVTATLAPLVTYGQHGGAKRAATIPHHTITASKKDTNCVGAVYLAQQNTGLIGRAAGAPMATVTATGSQVTPVTAWFSKYYGTGDGARMDEPCHTVTVKDRFSHMQAEIGPPPSREDQAGRAREVADFLRLHDAWDEREFVTLDVDGETYVIVDVGLRMLTPRELFRAQGFPDDYVIEGVWDADDWTFHPFTKDVQVSCCGNSVCPPLAEALVRENCAHLIAEEQEARA